MHCYSHVLLHNRAAVLLYNCTAWQVWEGKDVIKYGRTMIGATNPLASAPGTIRGDFGVDVGRNIIHGSDGVNSAQR